MMTTWAEVLTGDLIRGADELVWLAHRRALRGRAQFALTRPDRGTPILGTPAPGTPVERVALGSTSYAIAILREAFPNLSIMEES